MNIYIRTRTADPSKLAEAATYAVEVADLVTEISGVEILPWTALHGRPLGSTAWTWRTASLAEGAALQEKVRGNPDFIAKVREGDALFHGPVEDVVGQVVSAVGDAAPSRYATTITAQCQPGRMAEAMQWAVSVQEESSKLTGRDGLVVRTLYGPFASVSWITPADSLEQVEEASAAFADPGFVATLDEGGPLFIAGQIESVLSERLG